MAMDNAIFGSVVFLMLCNFAKDFSVFGLSYVFPQFFTSLSGSGMCTAVELAIMSILGVPVFRITEFEYGIYCKHVSMSIIFSVVVGVLILRIFTTDILGSFRYYIKLRLFKIEKKSEHFPEVSEGVRLIF